MYSLALLAVILLSFILFSGPIALILTTRWAKNLSDSKYVLVLRRSFLAAVNVLGMLLSLSVIIVAVPLAVKFIAMASIVVHVFAINREYGFISHFISRNPNGPEGQY
ncbi:MAG: hypothetical protein WCK44_04345 [Actinomycetota bacterium]